jgi:hypothetical protein
MNTIPTEFLLYIPGRKNNPLGPFSSFILIHTAASPNGYLLTTPKFDYSMFVHTDLPQVDPPIRPYKIFMDIALPNGIKDTRLVTDWTPYLHMKRGANGADLRIFSIPGIKSIFPGPMLIRNVAFTNMGLSEKQLNPITFPLTAAPYSKQQVSAATTLSSLSAAPVLSPAPVLVPASTSTSIAIPAPISGSAAAATPSVKPKVAKPSISSFASSLNPYVARQLLEFAQMKGEVCPITAGSFDDNDSAVMPCGHVFSRLAITESFKTQINKCPACRVIGSPTYI